MFTYTITKGEKNNTQKVRTCIRDSGTDWIFEQGEMQVVEAIQEETVGDENRCITP